MVDTRASTAPRHELMAKEGTLFHTCEGHRAQLGNECGVAKRGILSGEKRREEKKKRIRLQSATRI